ncbi:MAG: hypothetical protein J1F28_09940 [Oscillospiraceae bacterium]|nr:hypothetical protein [Oscillospiraceae bacterium]
MDKIVFRFDYNSSPILLSGRPCGVGDFFVNSDGYFVSDWDDMRVKIPDDRLKGETELEQKVKLIYQIYRQIWDISGFSDGEPYLGFTNEQERNDFFDACDYVIRRMKKLFGDEFTVWEYDERTVEKRLLPLKPFKR